MRYRFTSLIIIFLAVTDLAIMNITFIAGLIIVDDPAIRPVGEVYKDHFIVYNLLWVLCAAIFRLYHHLTLHNLESIFRATFRAMVLQQFLWAGYLLFTKDPEFGRQFLIVLFVLLIVAFAVSRFFLTILELYYRRHENFRHTVAIVGFNPTGLKLADYFARHDGEYNFSGFLDEKGKTFPLQSGPADVYMKDLLAKAKAKNINEVFAAIAPAQLKDVRGMIGSADELMIKLRLVPDLSGAMALTRLQVRYLGNLPVFGVRQEPLEDSGAQFKKSLLDILLSSLAVIFILSWLVPIIGLLIKLDSKGPVFFRQLRSGRDNKPFWCYKFRSMHVNDTSDSVQASKNDTRITKMGAILRKTSLDELPQIWNVLKGNMSIVGPRPHMLSHTEQYRKIIDGFMVRHFLKPGITGWAQVTGFRGETRDPKQMEERVARDVWYLENWSLMLDVRIIFLTVWVVIKGDENTF